MSEEEIKLSSDWWNLRYIIETKMMIIDADGWDRKNWEVSWHEPITWKEFNHRAMLSTQMQIDEETIQRVIMAHSKGIIDKSK